MKLTLMFTIILNFSLSSFATSTYKEPFKNGVYIIDGDTPVYSLKELKKIKRSKKHNSNKLILNTLIDGILDTWNYEQRMGLTYCISDEFNQDQSKKEQVINAMEEASKDWMDYANVKFIYLADQDMNCNEENSLVTFDVRPVNVGSYLARAFFPSTPRKHRNLYIDGSSFKYKQSTLVGILRHELGHVLGFRHEHTREEGATKCKEDDNFKPLTAYDSASVMHYPQCGGSGDILDLKLTQTDKEGAAIAYR